jgi:hypothetical protein
VLLTGIHLMRTGEIEANPVRLNESFRIPCVGDLILQKARSTEKGPFSEADLTLHRKEFEKLRSVLQDAHEKSSLPESPSCRPELNAFLIRLRTTFGS